MIEPVASILVGWAVGKVADALWDTTGNEIQSRFKKTDLTAAIEAGKQAVAAWEQPQSVSQHLFYHWIPKEARDFLTTAFTHASVQEELQRPLKQEGEPQLPILCEAFRQVAVTKSIKLNTIALEPWLQEFVHAYVAKTSYYINVQVAQQDYLKRLIDRLDDHRFLGMAVEDREVDRVGKLIEIFVMPDVQEERSSRWAEELLLERQAQLLHEQRSRSLRDSTGRTFSAAQLITMQGRGRSVLLGDPGSGKTSLVSYFAVTLANAMQKQLQAAAMPFPGDAEALRRNTKALQSDTEGLRPGTLPLRPSTLPLRGDAIELRGDAEGLQGNTEALLPILVKIREWARHPDLSLLDHVRQFAETSLGVNPLPADFFEYWLDRGQALILLDGLDEVADEAKRYRIVEEIQSFLGKYPHSRVIITSRPAGYRSDFFRTEEFPHYELQRFNDDKMNEFIDRWYDSRIDDPQERQRRKESLRKALNDTDRIKLLARNPLLLTIVALIHRYQAVLPKQRHKLYEKAVDTLITNWDQNKELSNHTVLKYLDSDDLKRLMESLAYWIHTQGNTGDNEGGTLIDRNELHQQLSRLIKEQKSIELYQAREEAKRFLDFVCDRTGLLNEQGQDCYAFVHKTFQEYLTAQEINYQRDNDDFEVVLTHIDNHLHDPHWREVLLLMVAQQAPKKAALVMRRILNANSPYEQWLHRDLLFAGQCLSENVKGLKAADVKLSSDILVPLLKLEVSDDDQIGGRIRSQVLEILCSLNETEFEVEALQRIKTNAIQTYRWQKYRATLGEEAAVLTELLQRLNDMDVEVRSSAVFFLSVLGNVSERVTQALLQRLDDVSVEVRSSAAEALGNLGNASEPVVQALLWRLNDQESFVRSSAAEALGRLGSASEPVTQALLQRLDDQESLVRSSAAKALSWLGSPSESVIQALLLRLKDQEPKTRLYAALALSNPPNASELAVQVLLLQFDDVDSNVRMNAAWILGNLGNASESVVQALLLRLNDVDEEMRSSAAEALGRLGNTSEPVIQALLQRLDDDEWIVRLRAAVALGRLGNTSEPVIQALLQRLDKELFFISDAAKALVNLGKTNDRILSLLVQWIEQHQNLENVGCAIDALGAIVEG
jgi:HEAT repeat protein